MKYRIGWLPLLLAIASGSAMSAQAGDTPPVLRNRSIGYVTTHRDFAVYMTPSAKDECPQGVNTIGTREQFKMLYPDDGTKRNYVDTAMAFEAEIWAPGGKEDRFPFNFASGSISYGLNLDGKIGPHDF